jgi:hypothetical protein
LTLSTWLCRREELRSDPESTGRRPEAEVGRERERERESERKKEKKKKRKGRAYWHYSSCGVGPMFPTARWVRA